MPWLRPICVSRQTTSTNYSSCSFVLRLLWKGIPDALVRKDIYRAIMHKWRFVDHLGEERRKIYLLILPASATDLLGDLRQVHLVSGLCKWQGGKRKTPEQGSSRRSTLRINIPCCRSALSNLRQFLVPSLLICGNGKKALSYPTGCSEGNCSEAWRGSYPVAVWSVQVVKTLGTLHSVINIDLLSSINSTIIPVCIQNNVSQHTEGCSSKYHRSHFTITAFCMLVTLIYQKAANDLFT